MSKAYDRYPSNSSYWTFDTGDFHYEPVQTGRAFDLEVSKQLGDDKRKYVNGHHGQGAKSRRYAGIQEGYSDAPDIIEGLHRTNGIIDETIKFITHSMGGVYGDGYVAGIRKYLNEHPSLKEQVKITLIADFDPYQGDEIDNDGKIKKQEFLHKGKGSMTGWLANKKEGGEGNYEYYQSLTSGDHSIFSFFGDISKLQEGTYTWNSNTHRWEQKK
jgi:hypothetical protein